LSGAAERNEDILYVCLDNEGYMNTGIQRSGATPFGAWTTTTPVGTKVEGKREFKKDLMAIIAAHDPPYAASLSIAHPNDFVRKVEKAKGKKGFRFLHVMTPCVPGWRSDSSLTVELARLAVETGMWTLYEMEDGEARTTYKPQTMLPVTDYLKLQGRFRHMDNDDIAKLQEWLCRKWYMHLWQARRSSLSAPSSRRSRGCANPTRSSCTSSEADQRAAAEARSLALCRHSLSLCNVPWRSS
jgi:pyruvate/2-oxoacid:ferredoxin oxidoreductase beta subunit